MLVEIDCSRLPENPLRRSQLNKRRFQFIRNAIPVRHFLVVQIHQSMEHINPNITIGESTKTFN
jgi:hypothetical protein